MYKFAIIKTDFTGNGEPKRTQITTFSADSLGSADIFFFHWVSQNLDDCTTLNDSVIIDDSGNEVLRMGHDNADFGYFTYRYEEI